MLYHLLTEG